MFKTFVFMFRRNIFSCNLLACLWYQENAGLIEWDGNFSLFNFMKSVYIIGTSSLDVLWNSPMNIAGTRVLFMEGLLIKNSISKLFRLNSSCTSLLVCIYQEVCPFHLNCQIYWHEVVSDYTFNFWRLYSDVISLIPDSLLVFLFFPIYLAKSLAILLTFLKQLLVLLVFPFLFYWFLILSLLPSISDYFDFFFLVI